MNKSLMERLVEAGYPVSEIYHHYSDLYVYVSDVTTAIIKAWCEEHGFAFNWNVNKFRDAITGQPMYDVAFQYNKSIHEELKKGARSDE